MSDWYMITPDCNYGMQDLNDKLGMYIKGRILPVGAIVPMEWKGKIAIRDLYIPANYLVEYEPSPDDLPILYALWPSVRPNGYQAEFVENRFIGSPDNWVSAWYKISEPDSLRNMSSVPYAYAALCDVEGVCKAGDLAFGGDIVPAAFFAGLNEAQFERLETIGLCSETWLNEWPHQYRIGYMRVLARPVMERVAVPKEQREALFEKFPSIAPKAMSETPQSPVKRMKKGR